ncbi:MAG: YhjD/YihY/BrkB family envelope integrity protein [Thermodesulfobacteriota bacterium]
MEDFGHDNSLLKWIRKQAQFFFQKIILTSSLFFKNELLHHAAATAFFFLLSITPILLLLLLTFYKYLASYPNISNEFFAFLKNIHSTVDKDFLIRIGLINVKAKAMGIFGLINLLWAGCWILTAIQKGLEIVFKSQKTRTTFVMNILSLLALTMMLGLAFIVAVISIGLNFIQTIMADNMIFQRLISSIEPFIRNLFPFVSIFVLVFLSYRFVPGTKPSTLSSLKGALWCTLAVILLHLLMARFYSVSDFNIVYGVLGSLILMLLWVHFTFVLYFYFAQYAYVSDNIDSLAIGRMVFVRSRPDLKGKTIEGFLFKHPKRVLEKYARHYLAGETIFSEGESTTDIFYVYRGRISVCRRIEESQQKLAVIEAGEVFGEMAYLLGEKRMATAISETESTILVISTDIFEELLQVNQPFARDVIQQLSNRLRKIHLPEKP